MLSEPVLNIKYFGPDQENQKNQENQTHPKSKQRGEIIPF